jgi:hypothetical protein
LLVCILCAAVSFAESDVSDNIFLQCMQAVVDNKIPEGFQRVSRTVYAKESEFETAALFIENGVIRATLIGAAFKTSHEANSYLSPYYKLHEELGTTYYGSHNGHDIYQIGPILAKLGTSKREDGLIVAAIMFAKNLDMLLD